MKTKKEIILLFSVIFFSCLFFSCEKEGDQTADCRISSITETTGSTVRTYTLTYNNDGRLSTLNAGGSNPTSKTFIYTGNTLLITTTTITGSSTTTNRDSLTLDDRQRPINIRQYFNDGAIWFNMILEYNGDNLVRSHRTTNTNAVPETTHLTYDNNGNVVRFESPSGIETMEYYTHEKVQPGDWLEALSLMVYGISVYPHKNLVKSYNNGTAIGNFSYEKNDDGLITKCTTTGGPAVSTMTYEYECD
jgi:hypothetical protein